MRRRNFLLRVTPNTMTLTGLAVVSATMLAGCAGSRSGGAGKGSEPLPAIAGRPHVAKSATEVAPGDGSDQLDFFDELETHELATQDDALHAVLLAFHGSSAPTYVQRAAIAKQLGLMDPRTNQQPREAVTAGEVSLLLSRSLTGGPTGTDKRTQSHSHTSEQAMASMQKLGVLPRDWRLTRGMTGPELLAAIKNAGHVVDERKQSAAGKE